MTIDKLNILEKLVEELLKEAPEEKVVQTCMIKAGIPDSKDPIDRINKVLLALHFEENDITGRKPASLPDKELE